MKQISRELKNYLENIIKSWIYLILDYHFNVDPTEFEEKVEKLKSFLNMVKNVYEIRHLHLPP